jgi:hypothetical protein
MAEITTAVGICNLALGHLGKPPITTIGENTRGGQLCDLHYEATRNALLRSHVWNFATKYVSLAEDAVQTAVLEALAGEYTRAFTLPSDLLKVVRTSQEAAGYDHDYRITKRWLYTNESVVAIEYVFKNTTVTDYDALFVQVLALDLAIAMCMVLASSASLLDKLTEMRRNALPVAQSVDAQEGSPRDGYASCAWLQARL